MTVVACVLVAALVAATIAQCRTILRGARWSQRRGELQVDRAAWDFDAECDYAGLRALARVREGWQLPIVIDPKVPPRTAELRADGKTLVRIVGLEVRIVGLEAQSADADVRVEGRP